MLSSTSSVKSEGEECETNLNISYQSQNSMRVLLKTSEDN